MARALRHRDRARRRGRGRRANYGFSPGDEQHAEPYAYVGPWTAEVGGELWNATGFRGAELTYAELLAAPDQRAAALEFFTHAAKEALGMSTCSGIACSRPTSCPRAA